MLWVPLYLFFKIVAELPKHISCSRIDQRKRIGSMLPIQKKKIPFRTSDILNLPKKFLRNETGGTLIVHVKRRLSNVARRTEKTKKRFTRSHT